MWSLKKMSWSRIVYILGGFLSCSLWCEGLQVSIDNILRVMTFWVRKCSIQWWWCCTGTDRTSLDLLSGCAPWRETWDVAWYQLQLLSWCDAWCKFVNSKCCIFQRRTLRGRKLVRRWSNWCRLEIQKAARPRFQSFMTLSDIALSTEPALQHTSNTIWYACLAFISTRWNFECNVYVCLKHARITEKNV